MIWREEGKDIAADAYAKIVEPLELVITWDQARLAINYQRLSVLRNVDRTKEISLKPYKANTTLNSRLTLLMFFNDHKNTQFWQAYHRRDWF